MSNASEQHGAGWRIWRASGYPSAFHLWGLKGNLDPQHKWSLSFDYQPNSGFRILGESHAVPTGYGVETFFTAVPRVSMQQLRAFGRTLVLGGRIWHGGASAEYDGILEVTLSPEQYQMLSVWLDEVEEKGGLSGLNGKKRSAEEERRQECEFAQWVARPDYRGQVSPALVAMAEKACAGLNGLGSPPEVHRTKAERDLKDGVEVFIEHVERDLADDNCDRAFWNVMGLNRVTAVYNNEMRAAGEVPLESVESRSHDLTARVLRKCVIKRK